VGAFSRTRLNLTVARFLEDACPLWRSKGDVFTKILRFSWNRIVGVNPLPRGASVGEFWKICHPRNIEFYKICEMSFQESSTCEAPQSRTCKDPESWTCEALKSRTCEYLKPWTCEARESRTCEDLKPWTCEAPKVANLWRPRVMNLRNHEIRSLRNSGIRWSLSSEVVAYEDFLNGETREPARSQVKDVASKSPGLVCELVASL
jgi:hypothetical protein